MGDPGGSPPWCVSTLNRMYADDDQDRTWAAPAAAGPVSAVIRLPASKSITNRALVLAALSDGPARITNPLRARDTLLAAAGLRAMGTEITEVGGQDPGSGTDWRVTGGQPAAGSRVSVDVGNAGTVMRFLPAVAALTSAEVRFDGDARARQRPVGPSLAALTELGARIDDGGRGAASCNPETCCEDPDASRVMVPPRSAPRPSTVNGTAPRPPSSMCTPSLVSAARIGPTGRCLDRSSPSKWTSAEVSAATAGRKRMTVPALPTSTRTREPTAGWPPVTRQSVPDAGSCPPTSVISVPIARSPPAASKVSLARSGLVILAGPSLSAPRTRARLVTDLDAGSQIRALTGPVAAGAGQVRSWSSSARIRSSVLIRPEGHPRGFGGPGFWL